MPSVAVSLTLSGTLDGGAAYNETFSTTSLADGTWKVLLQPMQTWGSFTATASCVACGGGQGQTVTIRNITFGDVWVASGQSNMGNGSPVRNNFWRNESYAGIARGNYSNIVFNEGGDSGGVTTPREELGNWVVDGGSFSGWRPLSPQHVQLGDIDGFAATPIFFAMRLTDLLVERGERPPPIGVHINAVGGTDLAAWAPYAAVAESACINATCMCADNWTEECPWQLPISNRTQCQCNGMQWARQQQPIVNMTIRGMIWYQGENDCHFAAGNSALKTGYGCTLVAMVAAYRAAWSVVPGTTPADFPFGSVLLADGSDFGSPWNLAGVMAAQTANYGRLPNAAIANAFLASAYDAGDPWMDLQSPNRCADAQCCVDVPIALGPTCIGDHRGQYSNSTPNQSSLHPRTKGLIADRLAQAAYVTVYAPPPGGSELLATGPLLDGCTLAADGASLTLAFDAAALKGERVAVDKPAGYALSIALENTATYVLVNASLPPTAHAGIDWTNGDNRYHGPYATGIDPQRGGAVVPGNEYGVEGWVAVMPKAGAAANEVVVDLAPLRGALPTAIRYAVGGGGNGDFLAGSDAGRFCCGPLLDASREPCPPASCPIHATGRLALPALPFTAEIVGGKCRCLPPQVCDA